MGSAELLISFELVFLRDCVNFTQEGPCHTGSESRLRSNVHLQFQEISLEKDELY